MRKVYEVNVGNIRNISCGSYKEAVKTFDEYVQQSKSDSGRASGENVFLFVDGEIDKEYFGTLSAEEDDEGMIQPPHPSFDTCVEDETEEPKKDIGTLTVEFFGLDKDPDEVYRTIKALDKRLHYYSEHYCNGVIDSEAFDRVSKRIRGSLTKLLGEEVMKKIHLNSDPRGAAIKIKTEFSDSWKGPKDWGGYGYFIK